MVSCVSASRAVRWSGLCGLLLVGLLSQDSLCLARAPADCVGASAQQASAAAPALAAPLPNTDGSGLLAKPAPFKRPPPKQGLAAGQAACEVGCATKFGTVLGSADGTTGYSNCASTCVDRESSFLDLDTGAVSVHAQDPQKKNLRYVGVTYQCVEYARRWWMQNQGITFGDVPGASDIIYLTEAQNIRSDKVFPLARSINGTAQRPPRRGDLVIYYPDGQDPNWRYGHVAVVVDVDLTQGIVSLAEQNYSNVPWQDADDYARRIRLFQIGGRYTLVDVLLTDVKNPSGGRIAGWVYPLSAK